MTGNRSNNNNNRDAAVTMNAVVLWYTPSCVLFSIILILYTLHQNFNVNAIYELTAPVEFNHFLPCVYSIILHI